MSKMSGRGGKKAPGLRADYTFDYERSRTNRFAARLSGTENFAEQDAGNANGSAPEAQSDRSLARL